MSISKDVIKQCLISKQREVDEAVIVNRPVEFEDAEQGGGHYA